MTTSNRPELTKPARRGRKWPIRIGAAAVVAVVAGAYLSTGSDGPGVSLGTTFTATRGNLEITVVEGGSIEAKDSQQLKSEVQGTTKILTIVDEGYFVTPQDVAEGKVLIELDSKELLDRLTEQELQYQNALASFTEAREEYGIRINQNQSDLKAAELQSKFALIDLKKFLGEENAGEIARQVEETVAAAEVVLASGSEKELPPEEPANADPAETTAESDAAETVQRDEETGRIALDSAAAQSVSIDFSKYANLERLGDGEARQSMRKFEDDVVLAEEEVGVAESRLAGTKRLFDKDFVTKTEMENDELALKRKAISMEAAQTGMELYVKYEFPKQAEKLVSDYEESLRRLQRTRKLAVANLAKAEANLNSAEARFELQSRRRDELTEQIDKCVIKATKPGLVVYGEGNRSYYRDNDRIEEGATVRERQVLITIPDNTQMTVEVKVHESYVKKVVKGQKARIVVDAFPDQPLTGVVDKIAVLPDSQNRWMNPELKVYATTILIDGHHDWLKPGMSAEGEIVIETLADVVKVPLQAVVQEGSETVVYVVNGGLQRRKVVTGSFDTTFIEVKEGVQPVEVVALRSPKATTDSKDGEAEEDGKEGDGEKKEEQPPAESTSDGGGAQSGAA